MPGHGLKYLITRCQAAYHFHSGIVEVVVLFRFPVDLLMKMPKGGKNYYKKIQNAALFENRNAEPVVAFSGAHSIVWF